LKEKTNMKKISVLLIISFLASIALGKGEPIPPYKLEGAPAKQVKYYPAGRNQWDKIPECESLGEHYEICPICRGSGELIYFVKGRRVGTYDCFKCGPGSKSNSPDGLITAKGEDIRYDQRKLMMILLAFIMVLRTLIATVF
jgi:hypothetical protein